MSQHPSDDELMRHAEGEGPPAVAAHVRACEECGRRVEYMRAVPAAVRAAEPEGDAPPAPEWLLQRILSEMSAQTAVPPGAPVAEPAVQRGDTPTPTLNAAREPVVSLQAHAARRQRPAWWARRVTAVAATLVLAAGITTYAAYRQRVSVAGGVKAPPAGPKVVPAAPGVAGVEARVGGYTVHVSSTALQDTAYLGRVARAVARRVAAEPPVSFEGPVVTDVLLRRDGTIEGAPERVGGGRGEAGFALVRGALSAAARAGEFGGLPDTYVPPAAAVRVTVRAP